MGFPTSEVGYTPAMPRREDHEVHKLMGFPTSEVGYTPAMPRREDHEVHKRTCGGIGRKKKEKKSLKIR